MTEFIDVDSLRTSRQDAQALSIVDVGVITAYNPATGRAVVAANDVLASGKMRNYTGVEVVFPSGVQMECENRPCLLFRPRSVIPSLRDQTIAQAEPAFSATGMKAIPVGLGVGDLVQFQGLEGSWAFSSNEYVCSFSQYGVSIIKNDGSFARSICFDDDNTEVIRRGDWVTTIEGDGSISSVNPNLSLSMSSDGGLKIEQSEGATIELSSDGEVSIEAKGAINVIGAGINVDAGASTLTLKNGQSSVFKVLDALLKLLNGGSVATAGSQSAQTITSGQFTTVIAELAKIMSE